MRRSFARHRYLKEYNLHHIMFDVDGTLVESYDFDEQCYIAAVHEVLGHEIDANWASYEHVSDVGILIEHLDRCGIHSDRELIIDAVKNSFVAKIKQYLSENTLAEIPGASGMIKELKKRESISLSIATGGWRETALMKLHSAGIDVSGIAMASSNDHFSRTEIMKVAKEKAKVSSEQRITYFGDAAWDLKASKTLGYNFILVGDRISHTKSVSDLKKINQILSLIGME